MKIDHIVKGGRMKRSDFCGIMLLITMLFIGANFVFAEDALFIDEDGNVGIGTEDPEYKLHVDGKTKSNSHIIYHYNVDAPDDIWGGPYLINQTGFIGHMGGNALDLVWNGYRRTSDNKFNLLGLNGSDTLNIIHLCDSGINFISQDGMSDGDSWPASRMIIKKNGYVGIGTDSPVTTLDVRGAIRQVKAAPWDIWIQGGASTSGGDSRNLAILGRDESHGDTLYINWNGEYAGGTIFSGKVGINQSSPLYNLDIVGVLRVNTTLYYSDKRMKKNIKNIDSSLKQLTRIRGVSYEWNDEKIGKKKHFGVLASEIEEVFPELVYTDDEGIKSVDYVGMIAPMIEAMKELKAENDDLRGRLEAIEDMLNTKEPGKEKK